MIGLIFTNSSLRRKHVAVADTNGLRKSFFRAPPDSLPFSSCQLLRKHPGNQRLGLFLDTPQMFRTTEAFRVDLVHLFSAGGARGEPAVLGDYLEPADWRLIARSRGQRSQNLLARQFIGAKLIGRQRAEDLLLFRGAGRVDPFVNRSAEFTA